MHSTRSLDTLEQGNQKRLDGVGMLSENRTSDGLSHLPHHRPTAIFGHKGESGLYNSELCTQSLSLANDVNGDVVLGACATFGAPVLFDPGILGHGCDDGGVAVLNRDNACLELYEVLGGKGVVEFPENRLVRVRLGSIHRYCQLVDGRLQTFLDWFDLGSPCEHEVLGIGDEKRLTRGDRSNPGGGGLLATSPCFQVVQHLAVVHQEGGLRQDVDTVFCSDLLVANAERQQEGPERCIIDVRRRC
mmetsp:Transcript_52122/g.134900  ORF Transcript_52122/g.134900 Transcript_52122/m.134900 type:complete len:246 (+) Transcript_52122:176-913(+)